MPARAPAEHLAEPPARASAPAAAVSAAAPLTRDGLLQLQRTAGNTAVRALLQRVPAAPAADIAGLRKLLEAKDENGAIAYLGRMAPDDVATALADRGLRDLAVRAFDDEQMAHAMYAAKGGSLVQKLNWLDAEDSSWKLVKPLLTDPALPEAEKTAVYSRNYLRSFFTKVCDDDEMEEAVGLLGGSLEAQLNWMFVEGTNEAAVKRRLRAHPPAERIKLYRLDYIRDFFVGLVGDDGMAAMVDVIGGTLNDRLNWMAVEDTNYRAVADRIRKASDTDYKTVDAATRARLKDDLSAKEFAKVEAMLDRGMLDTEEVDKARDESHWEKKSYTDPTAKWYMETFEVESKYQIERSRSELRIRVRIRFKGITPSPAHTTIWLNGINHYWNGTFHLENADGKQLPIVFEPQFGAASPHHTIELHPPVTDASGNVTTGREDAANWYAGPAASATDTTDGRTAAHEFGHLVGLADEYQLTKKDYERIVGPAPAAVAPAGGFTSPTLMGNMSGGVALKHMDTFVAWVNARLLPGEKAYAAKAGP